MNRGKTKDMLEEGKWKKMKLKEAKKKKHSFFSAVCISNNFGLKISSPQKSPS
jgi:hypothetical protein